MRALKAFYLLFDRRIFIQNRLIAFGRNKSYAQSYAA